MPTYKLYYFDLKGRAEAIRMLFAYAGVKFEDVRIPYEDWPTMKLKMPYRQMPVLEVNGKKYCQSAAILRYLGREFNLAGKTSLDQAKADEFSEACHDVMSKLPITEKDEDKKEELMRIALTETVPPILALIEENMTGEFYAQEVTYADIAFAYGASFLMDIRPDMFDATPKLKALQERIYSHPNITNYLKEQSNHYHY